MSRRAQVLAPGIVESDRAAVSRPQVVRTTVGGPLERVMKSRSWNQSGSPKPEFGARNCTGKYESEMRALGVAGNDPEAHDADAKHPSMPLGVPSGGEAPRRASTTRRELRRSVGNSCLN